MRYFFTLEVEKVKDLSDFFFLFWNVLEYSSSISIVTLKRTCFLTSTPDKGFTILTANAVAEEVDLGSCCFSFKPKHPNI